MSRRLDTSKIVNQVVDVSLIIPHPDNPRMHPDEQVAQLASSHQQFGQYRSVVLWQRPSGQYMQVAGHGYLEGAKREGATTIRADILPEDTDPVVVKAILVADNLHAQNSSDDETTLVRLLQEQVDAGYDLASLGSGEETLRQMLESLGESYLGNDGMDEAGDDEPVEIEEEQTRVKLGDVWQLGRHRIICSNSLKPETYTKLLDGVRPHVIIADPPYGMRLDADFSGMQNKLQFAQEKGLKSGRKYDNVIGDHEDFDASAIVNLFSDVDEQFWFGADYYSATLPDTMHSGCWIVWDKRLDESADKMFGSCFELLWSRQKHKRDMLRHKWAGVFGTEHEPQRGRQHPNQKPVRLLEDIITRYVNEGQIILDPFLGSGTTVVSAERTNRTAYGCELLPAYVNVCIARWEAQSGEEAKLLERLEVVNAE